MKTSDDKRTPEQIAEGEKRVEETKRLRAFVKDVFYPQLILTTTSIEDAKYLLTSFSNMVMEMFLALMKEKKFAELDLKAKLAPDSPKYAEFVRLLDLFNDETVFTAREIIEGMRSEIEMNITNELKTRTLDSLKTNWMNSL